MYTFLNFKLDDTVYTLVIDDFLPFDQIGQQIIGNKPRSVLFDLRQESFVNGNDEKLLFSFDHYWTATISINGRDFVAKNVILVDVLATLLHSSQ